MAAPTMPRADRAAIGAFLTRRAAEALGVGLLALTLLIVVALVGHDANDPSLNRAAPGPAANPLGWFGSTLADLSL